MCYYKKKCGCEEGNCNGSCVDVTGRCTTECYSDGDSDNCRYGKHYGDEDYHAIESQGGPTPGEYYGQHAIKSQGGLTPDEYYAQDHTE